ncbi:MAG: DNA recombination protein RmuC [Acidimicrobiales bacterium]
MWKYPEILVVAGVALGFVLGIVVAVAVFLLLRRARADQEDFAHQRALDSAYSQVTLFESKITLLESQLDAERRLGEQKQVAWDDTLESLKGEFARLSAAALRDSNEQFLQLAQGRLELVDQKSKGDLDDRVKSIEQLVAPVTEQLGRFDQVVRRMESDRQLAYAGLVEQVKQLNDSQDRLQHETRNLVTALRAPATRGRWGELQLRRVVEMAGMLEHCDFDEQVTTTSDNGRFRPDVIVHLSGGRNVIVDAKVPLQAFLDANDATDEESRKIHLTGHARQMRAHVDSLSKKDYSQLFDFMPDFVVAFIPGDTLLAAALEHDPSLLEHAFEQRVVLATPTSLIAVLRSISFGWQQESITKNAQEVQKAGREMYKRLSTFIDHFAKAGRRLGDAVGAYNDAVGSLERKVLPQARRFEDLGIASAGRIVSDPEPIDTTPRLLQAPELVEGESRTDRRSKERSKEADKRSDANELWPAASKDGQVRMLPLAGGNR